jgi:hypothetical protein
MSTPKQKPLGKVYYIGDVYPNCGTATTLFTRQPCIEPPVLVLPLSDLPKLVERMTKEIYLLDRENFIANNPRNDPGTWDIALPESKKLFREYAIGALTALVPAKYLKELNT